MSLYIHHLPNRQIKVGGSVEYVSSILMVSSNNGSGGPWHILIASQSLHQQAVLHVQLFKISKAIPACHGVVTGDADDPDRTGLTAVTGPCVWQANPNITLRDGFIGLCGIALQIKGP